VARRRVGHRAVGVYHHQFIIIIFILIFLNPAIKKLFFCIFRYKFPLFRKSVFHPEICAYLPHKHNLLFVVFLLSSLCAIFPRQQERNHSRHLRHKRKLIIRYNNQHSFSLYDSATSRRKSVIL
jgi:hypothetical protein